MNISKLHGMLNQVRPAATGVSRKALGAPTTFLIRHQLTGKSLSELPPLFNSKERRPRNKTLFKPKKGTNQRFCLSEMIPNKVSTFALGILSR
jgi:hypothetical protein